MTCRSWYRVMIQNDWKWLAWIKNQPAKCSNIGCYNYNQQQVGCYVNMGNVGCPNELTSYLLPWPHSPPLCAEASFLCTAESHWESTSIKPLFQRHEMIHWKQLVILFSSVFVSCLAESVWIVKTDQTNSPTHHCANFSPRPSTSQLPGDTDWTLLIQEFTPPEVLTCLVSPSWPCALLHLPACSSKIQRWKNVLLRKPAWFPLFFNFCLSFSCSKIQSWNKNWALLKPRQTCLFVLLLLQHL